MEQIETTDAASTEKEKDKENAAVLREKDFGRCSRQ